MTSPRLGCPDLGVGVGLRVPHYRHVITQSPAMDFFEIISENFMVAGGKPLFHLDRVLETYRVVQHGVSMGIGGPDDVDRRYLERLRTLALRTRTPWLSDHFCWCAAGGVHLHDLLPLPYTEEAIRRVSERARRVQDFVGVPFALENTSTYLAYTSSTMSEWEFVSRVVEDAGIGLMFDVNNVYVAAYNHGFDPYEFISSVPHERIVQIHIAGHTNVGTHIIDTHSGHLIDPVLDLYRETIALAGPVSTLIEWDDEIPDFPVLAAEAERVRAVRDEGLLLREARREGRAAAKPSWDWAEALSLRGPAKTKLEGERHHEWVQGGPRESAAQDA